MLTNSEMTGRRILELIRNIKSNHFKRSVFILPKFFDYRYFQTYRYALPLEDEDLNSLELLADALNHNHFIETLDLREAGLQFDALLLLIDLLETNTKIKKIHLPQNIHDKDQENVTSLLNKIYVLCFNNKIRILDRKQKELRDKKEEYELVIGESCEDATYQLQWPYAWQLTEKCICQLFDFLEQHPFFSSLTFRKIPMKAVESSVSLKAVDSDDQESDDEESDHEGNEMITIIEIFKKRVKENRTVRKLAFTKCRFSRDALEGLRAGVVENTHIQVLEFDHYWEGQFNLADRYVDALCINRTINTFAWNYKVHGNGDMSFGEDTCKVFKKMLTVNKTLTHLSLRETGIWPEDDMKIFLSGMHRNTSLQSLDLSGWDLRFPTLSEKWRSIAVSVFKKLRYLNLVSSWCLILDNIDLCRCIQDKNCRLETLLFTIDYAPRSIERLSKALSRNQSLKSLNIVFCTPYTDDENGPDQTPTEALKSMCALLPPVLRRHPKLRHIDIGFFDDQAEESDIKLKNEVLSTLRLAWNFNVFLMGTCPSQPMKPNPSPICTAFVNSSIYDRNTLREIAEMFGASKTKVSEMPALALEDNTRLDDNPRPLKKMK